MYIYIYVFNMHIVYFKIYIYTGEGIGPPCKWPMQQQMSKHQEPYSLFHDKQP